MVKKFKQYNESLRDKMVGKSDGELDIAFDKSVIEMVKLILSYFNISKDEALQFIKDHLKTFQWSLEQEGKSVKEIYRGWEYLMYNRFGENKIRNDKEL